MASDARGASRCRDSTPRALARQRSSDLFSNTRVLDAIRSIGREACGVKVDGGATVNNTDATTSDVPSCRGSVRSSRNHCAGRSVFGGPCVGFEIFSPAAKQLRANQMGAGVERGAPRGLVSLWQKLLSTLNWVDVG